MIGWMRHAPRWTVVLVCVIAALLLLVGASSHTVDLFSHGLRPYEWAPGWLNLYWSSLALFDTLAAVLLILGRRRGVDLACAIMATDTAANWYAVHGIQHSGLADQPGLQRLIVFAALVLGTAPLVRPHLSE
ncbi:hypothetical protein [Streptomyces sp. ML-6]|uniref:hypothetical protein n=1 Tax=Streptomyces sp. ML-6 TaxID=2982693 RepID=UPI0024BFB80B|nr:hypothetical protein [Streptomyces sp. ML-6]MDK0520719.1 hypothetical protein [Streptomyces sp. ML-6]